MSIRHFLIEKLLIESRAKTFIKQGWNPEFVKIAFDNFNKADIAEYVLKVLTYGELFQKYSNLIKPKNNSGTLTNEFKDINFEELDIPEKHKKQMQKALRTFSGVSIPNSLKIHYNQLIDGRGELWENLNHYLSFDQYIQSYPIKLTNEENKLLTPSKLIKNLETWEEERIQRTEKNKKELDTGEPVIEFEDGWYWAFVDQEYCRKEGNAMGHCGNTASHRRGDTIYSLRTPKGSPRATFIINDGIVGEMKGRFNKKPESELHPYIVELLKSKYVKYIMGGGYAPENNFHLNDLNNEVREELLNEKPDLQMDLYLIYNLWEEGKEKEAKNVFYNLTGGHLRNIIDGELIEDEEDLSRLLYNQDHLDEAKFLSNVYKILDNIDNNNNLYIEFNNDEYNDDLKTEFIKTSQIDQSNNHILLSNLILVSEFLIKQRNFDLISKIVEFLKNQDQDLTLKGIKEYELDEIIRSNETSRGVRKLEKIIYNLLNSNAPTELKNGYYFEKINIHDIKEIFISMCDNIIHHLGEYTYLTPTFNQEYLDSYLKSPIINDKGDALVKIVYVEYEVNEMINEGYNFNNWGSQNEYDLSDVDIFDVSNVSDTNIYKDKVRSIDVEYEEYSAEKFLVQLFLGHEVDISIKADELMEYIEESLEKLF